MVHILESWEEFEDYAKNCKIGAYQIRDTPDGVEVRVYAGRFGYIREFQRKSDEKLEDEDVYKRILKFCDTYGFKKVVGEIPSEQFFV